MYYICIYLIPIPSSFIFLIHPSEWASLLWDIFHAYIFVYSFICITSIHIHTKCSKEDKLFFLQSIKKGDNAHFLNPGCTDIKKSTVQAFPIFTLDIFNRPLLSLLRYSSLFLSSIVSPLQNARHLYVGLIVTFYSGRWPGGLDPWRCLRHALSRPAACSPATKLPPVHENFWRTQVEHLCKKPTTSHFILYVVLIDPTTNTSPLCLVFVSTLIITSIFLSPTFFFAQSVHHSFHLAILVRECYCIVPISISYFCFHCFR